MIRGLFIFGFTVIQREKFPYPHVPTSLNAPTINTAAQSRKLAVLLTYVSQLATPQSHGLSSRISSLTSIATIIFPTIHLSLVFPFLQSIFHTVERESFLSWIIRVFSLELKC